MPPRCGSSCGVVKPTPGSQLALFVDYSYHAFITDRAGELLELEPDHRRHAEIENAIRDLKYGVGLNHLPSGRFAANAAWLAVQVIAHNLARWTARLGLDEGIVTTRTLRTALLRSRRTAHPLCPALDPAPPEALALGWPVGSRPRATTGEVTPSDARLLKQTYTVEVFHPGSAATDRAALIGGFCTGQHQLADRVGRTRKTS